MKNRNLRGFVACAVYAAVLGVVSFLLGRVVPKNKFHADRFPFKCSEKEARLYNALRVKSWQNKLPDMSRLFKKIMPEKRMTAATLADLPRMLQETCVAEATHVSLSLLGLAMPFLWHGIGGVAFAAVYILLGNVPFVIIQRYNRPRLQRLYDRRKGEK